MSTFSLVTRKYGRNNWFLELIYKKKQNNMKKYIKRFNEEIDESKVDELLKLKTVWTRHLEKAIELKSPSGELEMIRWFIRDIDMAISTSNKNQLRPKWPPEPD